MDFYLTLIPVEAVATEFLMVMTVEKIMRTVFCIHRPKLAK